MTQPHSLQEITRLEELFEAYGTDANSLKCIKHELQHSEVPRAVVLLARVEKALARLSNPMRAIRSSASSVAPATTPAALARAAVPVTAIAQPTGSLVSKVGRPATPNPQGSDRDDAVPWPSTLPPVAVKPQPAPSQLSLAMPLHLPLYLPVPKATPSAPERPAPAKAPLMSVEDAYKVLKATPGYTWEAIEQTRRQVVQQSHPEVLALLREEAGTLLMEQAQRANAAYEVLRLDRVA